MARICEDNKWKNVTLEIKHRLVAGMVIEGAAAALSLIGLFGICLQNDWMLITDSGITCCIIIPITIQMCFAFFLSKSHEVGSCQDTDYGVTKVTFQALQIMPFL